MKKNAKLAPPPTSLRHVAIFLHNADSPNLRVTKPPPKFTHREMLLRAGDWLWEKWRWGVLVKNNLPDGATCIKVIYIFSEFRWAREF